MRAFASRVIDARNTVEGKILSVLLSVLLVASLFNVAIFVNKANADEEEFIETTTEQVADVEESTEEESIEAPEVDEDVADGAVPVLETPQPEEPAIMMLGLEDEVTAVPGGTGEYKKIDTQNFSIDGVTYNITGMTAAQIQALIVKAYQQAGLEANVKIVENGTEPNKKDPNAIDITGGNNASGDHDWNCSNPNVTLADNTNGKKKVTGYSGATTTVMQHYYHQGQHYYELFDVVIVNKEYDSITYYANYPSESHGELVSKTQENLEVNTTVELITPDFTCEGYTLIGWSTTSDGAVEYALGADYTLTDEADVLYAVWKKNTPTTVPSTPLDIQARYIVQWIADDGATLKTDEVRGPEPIVTIVDDKDEATVVSVTGGDKDSITVDGVKYVFDANNESNVLSGELKTIESDEDIVTLKLYFTKDVLGGDEPGKGDDVPDKYQTTVTYKVVNGTWNDKTAADKTAVISLKKLENGSWVDITERDMKTPVDMIPAPGYGNGSWDNDPSKASLENGSFNPNTFTYTFQPDTNIKYTVEHYLQNAADDGYALAETETLIGTTDTEVFAIAKDYKGFALNESAAGTIKSGTIAGDGGLVLKLYYDRNPYSVSYEYEGPVPSGAPELPKGSTHKFGTNVPVAAAASMPGYTFSGWMRDGKMVSGETIVMSYEDIVLKGSWTANADTAYTVEYYKQNIADNGYILAGTIAKAGTTGETVWAEELSFDGFTLNKDAEGTIESGTIAGDGSLVLKLYYDRKSFQVTYKYATNPEGASALPEMATYKVGADVAIAPMATAPGYTFNGWKWEDKVVAGSISMPNADVEIVGSWTVNDYAWRIDRYLGDNPVETIYTNTAAYNSVIELKNIKEIGDYTRVDKADVSYTLVMVHNDGFKVAIDEQKNVITLNYDIDNNRDDIPDQFQVTFEYATEDPEKGTVTDDESGTVIDVRTLGDDFKKLTSDTITPGVPESVKLQAKDGWTFDGWDRDPYVEREVWGFQKITFKATWAEDKIGTGEDPEEGDGVADKYQVMFNYVAAANGTVSGTTKRVVTLGTPENPLTEANVVAGTSGVTVTAGEGYRFANAWTGADASGNACPAPTVSFLVKGGETYTFTAHFEAIPAPVVPGTTPVPPVVPGPGAPAPVPGVAAPTPEDITDDATPMAQSPEGEEEGEEEEIVDDENPLGAFDVKHCWTHWMMLLGILLTAAYGIAVARRRTSFTNDLDDFEKSVTGETAKQRGTVTVRTGSHQAI